MITAYFIDFGRKTNVDTASGRMHPPQTLYIASMYIYPTSCHAELTAFVGNCVQRGVFQLQETMLQLGRPGRLIVFQEVFMSFGLAVRRK